MVLLSITPLLDGVLRRDIIAPFHTSGPPLLQFHLAIEQWGKYTNSGNDRVITYPIAFSELYYANVISPDNCETFVYGISSTNINYRLCNGYNDDRWNGTQTSRLFAVGR